jgi:hypothetical protein
MESPMGKSDDDYSEQETTKRRDAALKRMLATPHKPHKPLRKKAKSKVKRGRTAKEKP